MNRTRKRKLTEAEIAEQLNRSTQSIDSDEETFDPFTDSGSEFRVSSEDDSSENSSVNDNDSNSIDLNHAGDGDGSRDVDDDSCWIDTEHDPLTFEFSQPEGLKVNHDRNLTPIEAFQMFFDENLLNKIVTWTNTRSTKIQNATQRRFSNMRRWQNTTTEEINQFLGLCIAMGNIKMPSIKSYWSKNIIYQHPLFSKVMSRNRFEMILRCMCFYDETDDTSSRLHKISNVLDHLIERIRNTYQPGENLSLDEALLLFRGRLCFRQYIPNKKARYGIKLYELCTPDGFVVNILIYAGKGTVTDENKGHAFAVVEKLMENYLDKGHTIYMDNFYCSVKLGEFLNSRQTHMIGTLRSNRKENPKYVTSKKLKKGESIWKRKGHITVGKWRDKRDVLVISTKHKFEMILAKNRKGNESRKPNIVVDYNDNMSGIDRGDQMVSYYSTPRKTIRWYMKLFFHLLDIALWNGHYIYKKITQKPKTFLEFRNDIILALTRLDVPDTSRPPMNAHFPRKVEKRKRCRICSQNKIRQPTWFVCDSCVDENEQPIGLCADPCFAFYHLTK